MDTPVPAWTIAKNDITREILEKALGASNSVLPRPNKAGLLSLLVPFGAMLASAVLNHPDSPVKIQPTDDGSIGAALTYTHKF